MAKKIAAQRNSQVKLKVADALNLSCYKNSSFGYLLYLQQILSLIPHEHIIQTLGECYRLLKKDGLLLISVLNYEKKAAAKFASFILRFVRFFRGDKTSKQYLPWLKLGGKINRKFLQRDQALVYWFKKDEIVKLLENAGFNMIEVKTSAEIMGKSYKKKALLYIVCRKGG